MDQLLGIGTLSWMTPLVLQPQEELQRVFLATETLRREREEAMSPHPKKSKKQIGTKIGLFSCKAIRTSQSQRIKLDLS